MRLALPSPRLRAFTQRLKADVSSPFPGYSEPPSAMTLPQSLSQATTRQPNCYTDHLSSRFGASMGTLTDMTHQYVHSHGLTKGHFKPLVNIHTRRDLYRHHLHRKKAPCHDAAGHLQTATHDTSQPSPPGCKPSAMYPTSDMIYPPRADARGRHGRRSTRDSSPFA